MEEKKKKKKSWLIILLVLLLAGGLTAGGLVLGPKIFKPAEPETTESESVTETEQTEEPSSEPEEKTKVELFWNVDHEYYYIQNPSEAGLSSRKKGDDGYYHILFAGESGRSSQRKVKDAKLMNRIDAQRVMALVMNDKGEVIDIKTIEELGYSFVYDRYYVADVYDDYFLVDSSPNYNGIEEEIPFGDYKIIDVSGFDESESVIGQQMKKPRAEDRVVAVADENDNILTVFVIERTENTPVIEAYCEHCHADVRWKGWPHEDSLPVSTGHYTHYYLSHDIQQTGQAVMKVNTKLCLDLNGHTVESAENWRNYVLSTDGTGLYIMDHSEGEKGVLRCHGTMDGAGGSLCLSKGECELYSGTIDASDWWTPTSGGCIYISANASFKMYGGTVIGGLAKGNRYITSAYKEASRGGVGGAIVVMGKLEINGGTIKDGKAWGEKYKTASGEVAYVTSYGANIYVTKTGRVEMNGGVIENGTVMNMGGNVCLAGSTDKDETHATFIMNGGTIKNGKNTRDKFNGGNVVINAGSEFVMNGGTISGGVARNCAGNVYVRGTFKMYGGRITGGACMNNSSTKDYDANSANIFLVYPENAIIGGGRIDGGVWYVKQEQKGSVTLSGSPVIKGNKVSFNIGPTMEVKVKNLGGGAYIGVTASDYFTEKVSADVKKYFHSDKEGVDVAQYEGKLFLGKTGCICGGALANAPATGHTCQQVPFKAWTSTTTLPVDTGNYYLTQDLELTGQSATAKDASVVIDLNGHTVTGKENGRMYITMNEGCSLSICDSVGGGKIVPRGTLQKDNAIGIYVRYGTLTMYGGTIDASACTIEGGSGVAVFVGDKAEGMTMYGGTIIGGKSTSTHEVKNGAVSVSGGTGGALVVMKGTYFNMYGGTIKDGIAEGHAYSEQVDTKTLSGTTTSMGGNVYIANGGTMTMKAVEGLDAPVISGGQASLYGGNVCTAGVFNMEAGTLENGSVGYAIGGHTSNGGNLQSSATGDVNISGGEIKNGVCTNCGGNISASGSIIMTGGTVTGGQASGDAGNPYAVSHNIFAIANDATNKKTIKFENVTLPGDIALYAATNPRDVIFSGKVVITKGTATGVYVPAGTILDVSGLSEESSISVNASGIFSTPTTDAIKACFTSEKEDMSIALTDAKELMIGIFQCNCGGYMNGKTCDGVAHTCTELAWGAWDSTTTLPTTTGNYILQNDIVLTAQPSLATPGTINIDLNGHKISQNSANRCMLLNNAGLVVTICDSKGTGSIVGTTSKFTGDAGTILVRRGSLTLYDIEVQGAQVSGNGGAIMVYGACTFNMYGGKISGGDAAALGGGLYALADSTVYLYGVMITGNQAAAGAGIYDAKANMTLSGMMQILENGIGNSANNDSNLYVVTGKPVVIGEDASGWDISVNNDTDGVFATITDSADKSSFLDNFTAEKEGKELKATFADGKTSFELNLKQAHKHCVCAGGTSTEAGHTCNANQEWQPLDSLAGGYNTLASGYYYLTQDVTVDAATLVNGKNITICLNGHKITANQRVLLGNTSAATLTFTDCAETPGTLEYIAGAECMIYLNKGGNLKVYNVTLTGANATVKSPLINMYAKENAGPTLEAYGATFIATKENPNGGCIQTSATAGNEKQIRVTADGCTFKGGNVTVNGGCINMVGILNVKNSEFSDSKCANVGGAIYGGAQSEVTLENVTVKNCKTQNVGAGICMAGGKLTLSGNIDVTTNTKTDNTTKSNIYLSGSQITITNATEIKAGIGMTTGGKAATAACTSGQAEATAAKVTITSDLATKQIVISKKETEVSWTLFVEGMHLDHCICGGAIENEDLQAGLETEKTVKNATALSHVCADVTWKEIGDINTLGSQASGYYYLTSDQTLTSQQMWNGKNIVLCLNGHTITAQNRFLLGNTDLASLTITDCQATPGTIKWEKSDQTLFFLHNYGTLNLYGGVMDGSEARPTASNASAPRAVIYLMNPSATVKALGTANIYGGTIIGVDNIELGSTAQGSTVYALNRAINIYGGTITGGKNATTGGNVFVGVGATGTMYGGTISDGVCEQNGGNLSIDGTFTMCGGTITGGVADSGGGNVRVNGTFYMYDGEIVDGSCPATGGT